jgi:prepilin-type processing-associated H-X9-DG protein
MNNGNYWSWWDWPAWYHNGRSTLGFADGHAEKHDWKDERTQDLMRNGSAKYPTDLNIQLNNEDLVYMNNGYVPAGW